MHENYLGRITKLLLFGLILMITAGVKMWKKWKISPLLILLPSLSLMAFMTAAFGDATEPIKHQYLFNVLLDACILLVLSSLNSLAVKRTDSRTTFMAEEA